MYFADRAAFHIALASVALFNILPLQGEKVPHIDDIEYTKDVTKYVSILSRLILILGLRGH